MNQKKNNPIGFDQKDNRDLSSSVDGRCANETRDFRGGREKQVTVVETTQSQRT